MQSVSVGKIVACHCQIMKPRARKSPLLLRLYVEAVLLAVVAESRVKKSNLNARISSCICVACKDE